MTPPSSNLCSFITSAMTSQSGRPDLSINGRSTTVVLLLLDRHWRIRMKEKNKSEKLGVALLFMRCDGWPPSFLSSTIFLTCLRDFEEILGKRRDHHQTRRHTHGPLCWSVTDRPTTTSSFDCLIRCHLVSKPKKELVNSSRIDWRHPSFAR